MPTSDSWPLISIVTPSFNQVKFIEETIRSVLLQGYPNREYIVIDGGSTDGSVDLIRKYEPWLKYWVSEPDHGLSHAINKGIEKSSGQIFAYLNSDDLFLPDAFKRAILAFQEKSNTALVYSDGKWIDEESEAKTVQKSGQLDAYNLLAGSTNFGIPQPTAFMRLDAVREAGGFDESLPMAMDLDMWLKLALRHQLYYLPGEPLAALRAQPNQKTQRNQLEDKQCSLQVLERALADPLCPPGVVRRGNLAINRLWLQMASICLQQEKDVRKTIYYFMRALSEKPWNTFATMGSKVIRSTYRTIFPSKIQNFVRQLR